MIARTVVGVTVAFAATFSSSAFANGYLYQLPKDGAWVRFDEEGKGTRPDGAAITVSGKHTISSVGTVDVDGKRCRWIEISTESKLTDRPVTLHVVKLLIPEEHIGKGKEPLKHTLKIWSKHSAIDGGKVREIKEPAGRGGEFLKNYLPGRFEVTENLEEATVDSKLGRLECMGIVGREKQMRGGTTVHQTLEVRIHERAHFGVVSIRREMSMERDGKVHVIMTSIATLKDFGMNATSSIPDAK